VLVARLDEDPAALACAGQREPAGRTIKLAAAPGELPRLAELPGLQGGAGNGVQVAPGSSGGIMAYHDPFKKDTKN